MVPCSIWMPPAASGPVFTVSRPILTGLPCARATRGSVVASVAPAAPTRKPRRSTLSAIADSFRGPASVALGQPEDVLREIVQNHLLRDRRDLVEADLAPEPLDVELLRVAVP